jgi:hypothetical protein
VTDAGYGDWSPAQRDALAAMGFEVLALRRAEAYVNAPAVALQPATQVRLVVSGIDAALAESPPPLLAALLRALCLRREEIATRPLPGVPELRIGGAGAEPPTLPDLTTLRSARAKRDAWPILRRLRRALQDARPAS